MPRRTEQTQDRRTPPREAGRRGTGPLPPQEIPVSRAQLERILREMQRRARMAYGRRR